MNQVVALLQPSPARWALAIGWTLLLCLFLLQPEADPLINLGLPKGDSTLAREVFFSALHLLAFALTCFVWFWTLRRNLKVRTSLLVAVVIAIVLGIVTESLQTLTLDRHASFIDLAANFAGALIAARVVWQRYA